MVQFFQSGSQVFLGTFFRCILQENCTCNVLSIRPNYVNQLKEQLEANAQQKLHSWNEAEQMVKVILDEYGLKM